jgi:hypothetical protein
MKQQGLWVHIFECMMAKFESHKTFLYIVALFRFYIFLRASFLFGWWPEFTAVNIAHLATSSRRVASVSEMLPWRKLKGNFVKRTTCTLTSEDCFGKSSVLFKPILIYNFKHGTFCGGCLTRNLSYSEEHFLS